MENWTKIVESKLFERIVCIAKINIDKATVQYVSIRPSTYFWV